jgi:UrcA family protein
MRYLTLAASAAAAVLVGAPAFAQSVEELTVTGHASRNHRDSISRIVSFADLDLTRQSDRRMLRARVNDAASDVCEELNEPPPAPGNLGRSCQEIARRDAVGQVRLAVTAARGAAYADAAFSDPTFFAAAPSADASGAPASTSATYTTTTVSNGPVADTPENRARYGAPMSHAGKRTLPRGN